MKALVLASVIFLSGCFSTPVPVKQKWPQAPEVMMNKCQDLKTIDQDEVKLSEFLKTVVANYTLYHECAGLVRLWQEWYKVHKQAADEINNKK